MSNDPTHKFLIQKIVPIEIGGDEFSVTLGPLVMAGTGVGGCAVSSFLVRATGVRVASAGVLR